MKKDSDTAVILAAGNGTRRMPITRVIEKVMLPIGNRPTVDYVVEQCVQAGINRIVFVVSPQQSQIRSYYGAELNTTKEYPWLSINTTVRIEYAVQDQDTFGYGTASAVLCTRKYLGTEDYFIVVAGDAFLYSPSVNPIKALRDVHKDGATTVLMGLEVPLTDVSSYGIITTDKQDSLISIVEKPDSIPDTAKPLANISYYLFNQSIFDAIETIDMNNNEYYITDALLKVSEASRVSVVANRGLYLDSGQLEKWITANQILLESQKIKPIKKSHLDGIL